MASIPEVPSNTCRRRTVKLLEDREDDNVHPTYRLGYDSITAGNLPMYTLNTSIGSYIRRRQKSVPLAKICEIRGEKRKVKLNMPGI